MRRREAAVGRALLVLLGAVALLAPLLANDRPLVLRRHGRVSFPAVGELALIGRLIERPEWATQAWGERLPEEAWRVPAPIPYSYRGIRLEDRLAPPSRRHLLGTDTLGRDLAARILHGAAVSLQIGLLATALALGIGLPLGALAGHLGGVVDFAVSRAVEVVICFPTFFLVLSILAFRPPSIPLLFLVIGLTRWPAFARYTRGEVLRVREAAFIEAARALGAGSWRVLVRHLLPHALTPVLVATTFSVAGAMLVESGLSFLGFGVPEPLPSWGGLLSDAMGTGRWWLVLFPGLALTLAVTATQLAGEGMRDALDPRIARL